MRCSRMQYNILNRSDKFLEEISVMWTRILELCHRGMPFTSWQLYIECVFMWLSEAAKCIWHRYGNYFGFIWEANKSISVSFVDIFLKQKISENYGRANVWILTTMRYDSKKKVACCQHHTVVICSPFHIVCSPFQVQFKQKVAYCPF